jgi:hypothetical protein
MQFEESSSHDPYFQRDPWRRRWDLNPRKVSLHTISNRADSAALALLPNSQHSYIKLNTGSQGYLSPLNVHSGNLLRPRSTAVVGSRATTVREPSQGWKPAALSELCWVPRIAWPPLWTPASCTPPLA